MNIVKIIDQFLLKKWEWSKTEMEEKFWLDITREFLLTIRRMRKHNPHFEYDPIWNSFLSLLRSFEF